MDRKITEIRLSDFPPEYHSLLEKAKVYDSSCSREARVWFLDCEDGYYLKCTPKGDLKREADMTRFFHEKGLSAEVLSYRSDERDWMLTRRIPGEDLIHPDALAHPEKLVDFWAETLRMIHELDVAGCPVPDHTALYFEMVERAKGNFTPSYLMPAVRDLTMDEAYAMLFSERGALETNTLLHGDYCLPNLLARNFTLTGLIDVGNGGVGDRHVDLYWGAWTLHYNLKTDVYRDRFYDAYGRDRIDPHRIDLVSIAEALV